MLYPEVTRSPARIHNTNTAIRTKTQKTAYHFMQKDKPESHSILLRIYIPFNSIYCVTVWLMCIVPVIETTKDRTFTL
jgi:hypothetical protein